MAAEHYPTDLVIAQAEQIGQLGYAVAAMVRYVDALPVDTRPATLQDPVMRDLRRLVEQFRAHPAVVQAQRTYEQVAGGGPR